MAVLAQHHAVGETVDKIIFHHPAMGVMTAGAAHGAIGVAQVNVGFQGVRAAADAAADVTTFVGAFVTAQAQGIGFGDDLRAEITGVGIVAQVALLHLDRAVDKFGFFEVVGHIAVAFVAQGAIGNSWGIAAGLAARIVTIGTLPGPSRAVNVGVVKHALVAGGAGVGGADGFKLLLTGSHVVAVVTFGGAFGSVHNKPLVVGRWWTGGVLLVVKAGFGGGDFFAALVGFDGYGIFTGVPVGLHNQLVAEGGLIVIARNIEKFAFFPADFEGEAFDALPGLNN